MAGAGAVGDLGLWPAQLEVTQAGADQGGVVQGAVAVGVLLGDDHQEAVLEADRAPDPVEALGRVLRGEPAAVLARNRPHAPAAVPGARPVLRADVELRAARPDHPLHRARLDVPAPLQGEPCAPVLEVVGLPQGREGGGPREVVRQLVLADQSQPAQRLLDLDAQWADLQPHPVLAEGVRGPHGVQGVPGAQGRVGVDHAQVGVDPEAQDEQGAAGVVEDVEDAAVVGVAVPGRHVLHGQRHLVHGVLVERYGTVVGHGHPLEDSPLTVRQTAGGGQSGNRTPVNSRSIPGTGDLPGTFRVVRV